VKRKFSSFCCSGRREQQAAKATEKAREFRGARLRLSLPTVLGLGFGLGLPVVQNGGKSTQQNEWNTIALANNRQ